MNKYMLFIVLLINLSCSLDDIKKETQDECQVKKIYYSNSNIKASGKICNGKKEGLFKWFYSNGNIKSITPFVNDLKEGEGFSYYLDGILKYKCYYKNNKKRGKSTEYYHNGQIKQTTNYISIYNQKEGWKNTWIRYDSVGNGVDIKASHFFTIRSTKKAYTRNENWEIDIEVVAPYYDFDISILYGNFNEKFKSLNKELEKRIILKDKFKFKVKIPTDEIGKNVMRLIIDNYKGDWKTMNLYLKPTFVEYTYVVR